ncbi:MAG: S8 family peptidase [Saprospiraceae bacterium]|jgi:subtilisin family serine protease|nr:S8 family peptidase [Saprospiraceae bacterium]HRD79716.1 S8/S53 family peptidase [Saprospiraceae bacterium]HRJ16099.1 S8/S53 family peptidase [Saprospiraceae bacterium]HRK82155.1 S8/S53 family peptidase [Saprospiraceae bacterium]
MQIFTRFLLSLLIWSAIGLAHSAASDVRNDAIPGEIIVRFQPSAEVEDVLEDLGARFGTPLVVKQTLSKRLRIELLGFDPARLPAAALFEALKRRPEVHSLQWNYPIEFRETPNDPLFDRQWDLARIGLPTVWQETTGGLSARGDTIVIAILDSGFDVNHEDLLENIWYNRFEIPGDGIDNDNNGYIDDVQGWNFAANSATHTRGAHGTSVAGICGARGNNGIGVTGVNMEVRLMLFTMLSVGNAIAAYDYVVEQRSRYNATNGAQGSFVVVTNASWGQSRVFCTQQPVWAAMLDELGETGILTAAAVSNENFDVEILGDMPATCPTDFLISVLNTNQEDRKHQGSAFGSTSVDLGAPGHGTFTVLLQNEYGEFGGTSAATPHVSGAIALLYSLPCLDLATSAISRPAETALYMRSVILNGVDPLSDLTNKTVTGGRLNVRNSMEIIRADCSTQPGPLALLKMVPNPVSEQLIITYEAPDYEPAYQIRIFDALGRLVLSRDVRPPRFGEKTQQIDVHSWPAGVYFITLAHGEQLLTQRFVVAH